jgi:hypothetical protein
MVSLDAYMGEARQTKAVVDYTDAYRHAGRSGLRTSSACWVHRVGVEFSRRQNHSPRTEGAIFHRISAVIEDIPT